MALLDAGGEIGPNNLEMIPMGDQEFDDYCAGEILISAEIARSDYQCTTASPESFASLGPGISEEVEESISLTQQAVQSQTSITQQTIDAMTAPIITDQEIASAPNAVPVGSPAALSPFTQRQLDAARHDPINWPATLTVQGNMQRSLTMRRRRLQRINRHVQMPQQIGQQPTPAWGGAAASTRGWCNLGSNPWGKLLLFTGLGLIGAGLLQRK
jgi:hypothetical protein